MADEFKHKTVGTVLTQVEWEAIGGHEADGQLANDMLYYNGTSWIRATRAQIIALLSGQAGADFSMNTHKITGVVDPTANQEAATKKYHDDNPGGVSTFAALTDTAVARKSSDQTLTPSSVVLQDVTDLVFAVGANEVWEFHYQLWINSGSTPDFKYTFICPTGGTVEGMGTWSPTTDYVSVSLKGTQVVTTTGTDTYVQMMALYTGAVAVVVTT